MRPKTVVGWGLVLLVVFVAVAACIDVWYIRSHTLKAGEEAAIIAASFGAVTTLAGSVSAIFAALSASKTAEIGRRTEEAAARATEALSRSMLPSGIDAQIRVEPHAPRVVFFSINSSQDSWHLLRAARLGAGSETELEPLDDVAIDARGWRIPDTVRTNAEFDEWLSIIDLDITDAGRVARWRVHGKAQQHTYPKPPGDTFETIDVPVLYFAVQARASRLA